MHKRAQVICLLVAFFGICVVLVFLAQKRQPEIAGKPIGAWVQDLSGNYTNYSLAEEYLVVAGTNTVPYLLHELTEVEGSPRRRLQLAWYQLWYKLPSGLQSLTKRPQPPRAIDHAELIHLLAEIEPTSIRTVKAIVSQLTSQSQGVRSTACRELAKAGTNHADLVFTNLLKMLRDPDENVQGRAALSLAEYGWNPQAVTSALLQQLQDAHPVARRLAVRALLSIPGTKEKVLPAFTVLLQDPVPKVSSTAGYAICKLTGECGEAFEALLRALRSNDPDTQHGAAKMLGSLGPIADKGSEALEEINTKDMVTTLYAAEAYWRIHHLPATIVHTLQRVLLSNDRSARIEATQLVPELKSAAAPLLPELTLILKDPDFVLRRNAARALGSIGAAAQPVLTELSLLSEDVFPSVRLAAEEAVRRIEADR